MFCEGNFIKLIGCCFVPVVLLMMSFYYLSYLFNHCTNDWSHQYASHPTTKPSIVPATTPTIPHRIFIFVVLLSHIFLVWNQNKRAFLFLGKPWLLSPSKRGFYFSGRFCSNYLFSAKFPLLVHFFLLFCKFWKQNMLEKEQKKTFQPMKNNKVSNLIVGIKTSF